ncbi:MAG: hypothetical protein K6E50_09440 [Lachnospiraceae bacterium]|nr:hypothetical protein [Lachnospiraceae bacterium]
MGQLISIKCDKCGYSRELQIGQGMLDHRIEIVAEAFEGEAKERVLKAAESGKTWDFRRLPGLCAGCREYYSVPVFASPALPEGRIIGACPEGYASSDIRLTEEELPGHITCPKCGRDAAMQRGSWASYTDHCSSRHPREISR